jgi:hypothetical protein
MGTVGRLITVQTLYDLPEACVAKSYLESHGITVFMADRYFVTASWDKLFAAMGLRLQVPEAEAETARNLLDDRPEDSSQDSVDRCPQCSTGDVFRHKSWIVAAIFFAFNVPFLRQTSTRTCRQCGHRWKQTDPS